MKRTTLSVLVIIAVTGGVILSNRVHGDTNDAKAGAKAAPDKKGEAKAPEEPLLKRDTNGNVVIHFEEEDQQAAGFETKAMTAAQLSPELKAYGRVLDPAPLAALLTELATAKGAGIASSNELARLKTLSTSGNASARALETAEAAALRDQLAVESARNRLVLSWGKEIAEKNDLPGFIQSLASLDVVLIRLDLAAGKRLSTPPATARITSLSTNTTEAQLLGAALSVDPQTQGQGFVYQVTTNQSRFLPGEAVTGFLKIPGDPLKGVVVPSDAVLRTEGRSWIYVATDEDHFARKEITLDRPTDGGWFVTNNVIPGDLVLTVGAQSLLSEESKPAGPPD